MHHAPLALCEAYLNKGLQILSNGEEYWNFYIPPANITAIGNLAEGQLEVSTSPEANHPTVGDWQVRWQIDRSGCQVVRSCVKYNMMYVCSFYFPTWPSPWTNRWAPHHRLLNYYINWLPSMGPYSMSYMHLGSLLLTCLEQHFVQQTGVHELDLFCAWGHLTCHAMGHPLHKGQCLLDQHIILHISCLQQELSLASILHTTCVIFVIHVDRFIIFINLSN